MTYKKGDRIVLVHTTDQYTDLTPGTKGTVKRYNPAISQLSVEWDDGSTLSMLLDEGDEVHPV
ncbi:DUF4314 domain-containing protein [Streptomyces sp. NPDC057638]|uniref:DUF4314 domain-containing protein n=1 Tax=Streptomyces sp. NPDC057638 TaxID=3346190 RepID=UPI0036AE68AF